MALMQTSEVIVYAQYGRLGTIDTTSQVLDGSQAHLLVILDNGRRIWVPYSLLEQQPDGSYLLPVKSAQLSIQPAKEMDNSAAQVLVLPIIEEQIKVRQRQVTSGVRITKQVSQQEELVDEPGFREEVDVTRIPRNQILEGPISSHYEGDTLVIPLVEEVVVVEKRLLLREELHITKRREEMHNPQQVTLRREEVTVEPIEETSDE